MRRFCTIWYHLYNLKHLKYTHSGAKRLLQGCFSRFLYCTNGTKSRKTSQIKTKQELNLRDHFVFLTLYLTPGGNKRVYTLKQTCSFQLQVCLCMNFLLPPGIKGLRKDRIIWIILYTQSNKQTRLHLLHLVKRAQFFNPFKVNVPIMQKPVN